MAVASVVLAVLASSLSSWLLDNGPRSIAYKSFSSAEELRTKGGRKLSDYFEVDVTQMQGI